MYDALGVRGLAPALGGWSLLHEVGSQWEAQAGFAWRQQVAARLASKLASPGGSKLPHSKRRRIKLPQCRQSQKKPKKNLRAGVSVRSVQ